MKRQANQKIRRRSDFLALRDGKRYYKARPEKLTAGEFVAGTVDSDEQLPQPSDDRLVRDLRLLRAALGVWELKHKLWLHQTSVQDCRDECSRLVEGG